jgi:hypothetical protein
MSEGSYIRGASAVGIDSRRIGWILAVGAVVVLAVSTVLLLISALSSASAASRLRRDGVPVQATVTECTGVSSGIGMGIEFYTCRGSYALSGATFDEPILGSRALLRTGTTVAARVVPRDPATLTLTSAVPSSSGGAAGYTAPIAVGAVTLASGGGLVVWRRHRRLGVGGPGAELPPL